jgi:ABC-type branched-subunit amino acid transport system ATPase component
MNPDETDELMKDIWKLKSEMEKVTIVIIEHDMSVISTVSERVIVFNFGRKITEGTYEEVCNNKEVRESYLGKEFVYE